MNISDWITLAAVLVALGLGVSSLIQTQRLQKRERRERLLNEIIDWVVNILKLDSDLDSFTESIRLGISQLSIRTVDKLYSETVAFRDEGEYIKKTANMAGNKANDAVVKLQNELIDIAKLLNQLMILDGLVGSPDILELITTEDVDLKDKDPKKATVERHRKNLAQLCKLIIEEAAKIKTKDIG